MDLNPKQYVKAGTANTKTTMGHFINEVAIGGLSDADTEVEHPASFGPVHSQARVLTIPPGLQRNHNRRNKVRSLRHITMYSQILTCSEQLVDLASHAVTGFLEDKNNADTNHRPNVARTKVKIRATVRSQGGNPSMGLTDAPNPKSFVLERSWAKVFLPSLMYLFFISQRPFQDFTSDSPSFVAIVQEAFDATHPNVSFMVTAGDAIVLTVSSACILGAPQTEAISVVRSTQIKALFDSCRGSQACQEVL